MRFGLPLSFLSAATCALLLSACQGNLGSGSGLSIPQAPAPNQPQGPGQSVVSRQRAVEGAVYVTSPMPELPLPVSVGFAIEINLGTPGPAPTPTAVPTAVPTAAPRGNVRSQTGHARPGSRSQATPLPTVTPSPAATATADVAVHSLSELASPGAGGSAAPAAAPSAAPASGAPAAGTSPTPEPTTQPGHHPVHPSAAPSGPKIVTKTVAYPDDAPALPSPEPTGNVQTFPNRRPLVRGYLMSATDLHIFGLGAVRFTVPAAELLPNRGFTVAVFESGRHHHAHMVDFDPAPVVSAGTIASTYLDKPIDFRKNVGYDIVLYADETAATPAAPPSGYPAMGNNPLPLPSGMAPMPGTSFTPLPPGMTPLPPGAPNPYPSQTYFK